MARWLVSPMERTGTERWTHASMLEDLERLLYGKFLETHAPLSPERTAFLGKLSLTRSAVTEELRHSEAKGRCDRWKFWIRTQWLSRSSPKWGNSRELDEPILSGAEEFTLPRWLQSSGLMMKKLMRQDILMPRRCVGQVLSFTKISPLTSRPSHLARGSSYGTWEESTPSDVSGRGLTSTTQRPLSTMDLILTHRLAS